MASAGIDETRKSLVLEPKNFVIMARRVSEGGELILVRNPSTESGADCQPVQRRGRVCALGPLAEMITIKGIKMKQAIKDCYSVGKSRNDPVLMRSAVPDTLFLYQQYKLDIKALHPTEVKRKEKPKVASKQDQKKPAKELKIVEESQILEEPKKLEEPDILEEPGMLEEPGILEEPGMLEEPGILEEPGVLGEPGVSEDPEILEEPKTLEEPPPVEDAEADDQIQIIKEPDLKMVEGSLSPKETSKKDRAVRNRRQSSKADQLTIFGNVRPKDRFDNLQSAPLSSISEFSVLVKWKQHPSIPFYSLRNVFDVLSRYGTVVAMGHLSVNSCLVLFEQFKVAIQVVREALIGPKAYPLICTWYYSYMYLDSLELLDIHPYKKYKIESEESKKMRQFRDMQDQVITCIKNRGGGLSYDRSTFKA